MTMPLNLQNAIRHYPREHFLRGQWRHEEAEIVREEALTLFINGQEFVTMVITPTDLRELVVGFLAAEDFISTPDAITVFLVREEDRQVWVRIPSLAPEKLQQSGRRYLSSCCGRGRPGFYFAEDANIRWQPPAPLPYALPAEQIGALFEALRQYTNQQHSGGLHTAGLAKGGEILAMRTDVGRHNALDKLYGYSLLQNIPLTDKVIIFSGRLSSEVLIKVGRMGIPVVISNAAPTSLGIELAQTLGITAVGFARDQELSIYSHPTRLLEAGKEEAWPYSSGSNPKR